MDNLILMLMKQEEKRWNDYFEWAKKMIALDKKTATGYVKIYKYKEQPCQTTP